MGTVQVTREPHPKAEASIFWKLPLASLIRAGFCEKMSRTCLRLNLHWMQESCPGNGGLCVGRGDPAQRNLTGSRAL